MTYARAGFDQDMNSLPRLPDWIARNCGEALEDRAFQSGAALAHLHLVLSRDDVPAVLLRARLALRAAEACVTFSSRPERMGDLRDAAAFLQPGDSPGPAGALYIAWRNAVDRPLTLQTLDRALPPVDEACIAAWSKAGQGGPISRAVAMYDAAYQSTGRDHTAALMLSDAVLAQAMGWRHLVPILSLGVKRADLRKTDDFLTLACHRAVLDGAVQITREAADLSRRAARLKQVAPKLRAKGAGDALHQFLTQDAIAPSSLKALRSDRAARRLCDRLVELGVVRELTGRETFRLYGI